MSQLMADTGWDQGDDRDRWGIASEGLLAATFVATGAYIAAVHLSAAPWYIWDRVRTRSVTPRYGDAHE
jgi:hypothetical protein